MHTTDMPLKDWNANCPNTCGVYLTFFLTGMVKELTGGYKIKYHANGVDQDPVEIDFTPPFRYFKQSYNIIHPKDLIFCVCKIFNRKDTF